MGNNDTMIFTSQAFLTQKNARAIESRSLHPHGVQTRRPRFLPPPPRSASWGHGGGKCPCPGRSHQCLSWRLPRIEQRKPCRDWPSKKSWQVIWVSPLFRVVPTTKKPQEAEGNITKGFCCQIHRNLKSGNQYHFSGTHRTPQQPPFLTYEQSQGTQMDQSWQTTLKGQRKPQV